ncbi:MAG: secondary thiamine-phosphate synthase enzyme YjbQ [Chloroflexi bacterium]|nr:secondary thiamine-phosphate synthase enzyme YjbQ [Chloroflexota bacterium]
MRAFTKCLNVKSKRAPEFIDITDLVVDAVGESEVETGIAVVFSRHTTAAIKLNENEPLLIKDMEHFLGTVAPQKAFYGHNDFAVRTVHMHEDECPNGHAHCQHLMLGSSEMIPIANGQLTFGKWQRVFLVELDLPKDREVIVQIMGE